jgi:hypothetical protein
MATPAQINTFKHGMDAISIVIPGEDPAEYDALADYYNEEFLPLSASEAFHVDTMLRADWQKRRLQSVEAGLYHTILADISVNLIEALLASSPAAKLLARVQRQIAAFERTWYKANAELRRARAEAQDPARDAANPRAGQVSEHCLDFVCTRPAPAKLASFRESVKTGAPHVPPAPLPLKESKE